MNPEGSHPAKPAHPLAEFLLLALSIVLLIRWEDESDYSFHVHGSIAVFLFTLNRILVVRRKEETVWTAFLQVLTFLALGLVLFEGRVVIVG